MELSDFKIGENFTCSGRQYKCTDIGSRGGGAVPLNVEVSSKAHGSKTLSLVEATREGWFNGPPYAVQEVVFDEYDLEQCELPDTADAV